MPRLSMAETRNSEAMRVLLVANYQNDRQESMQRFAEMLRVGLRQADVDVEVIRPRPVFGLLKRGATGTGKWLGYIDKFLIFPWALKRRLSGAGKNVLVHIVDHSNAFYIRYISHVPHMVTCHDLLAVRAARGAFSRQHTGFFGRILQGWIVSGLKHAGRITCESEATRGDLIRLLGAPAISDVTPPGLNPVYSPLPRREAFERVHSFIGGDHPFILHVGGNQWYKNRVGVLAIHRALGMTGNGVKLVMAGARPDEKLRAFLEEYPESVKSIIWLPGVDDETLRALYSAAELLLFPSFEEGFGWPIIEAQACGCRVVTTGKPPMTEAAGEAAFFLPDPPQEKSGFGAWSEAAARVVKVALEQDEPGRAKMVAEGLRNSARFSVAQMTQRYVEIYKELLYKP